MSKRIEHIDIAKGISITLVAMFHSKIKVLFPEIVEPMALFRMPLFFFLSGVFFSYAAAPSSFFLKKSEALLKPYFSVLLIIFLVTALMGSQNLAWQLKGIFYGNGSTVIWSPMWFLTHLFLIYTLVYILFRFLKFHSLHWALQWGCLLLFLFTGAHVIGSFWMLELSFGQSTIELPGLPFSMDIALVTSVFFVAGYLLKEQVKRFRPSYLLLAISLFGFAFISGFTDAYIDFNFRVYANPVVATLGAIFGIYSVISCSYLITQVESLKKVLLALGGGSLYILIFHSPINSALIEVSQFDTSSEAYRTFVAIGAFLLSIFLPLAIKWLVLRNSVLALFFLPFRSNRLFKGQCA